MRSIYCRLLALTFTITLVGCTTTRVRTYQDPSLGSVHIAKVAVLPLQGTKLAPDIAISLNRGVTQVLASRNPTLEIMGPSQAQELLSNANLIDIYSQFLRNYATSGMIDKGAMNKIADALKLDAILQGDIWQIEQQDGYPYHPAFTKITLRYALIGLKDGVLLWENSATVRKELTAMNKAPEVEEVVPQAQSLALQGLPLLR